MANNRTKKLMKKLVLVALAVLISTMSFAQFERVTQCREALAAKSLTDLPTWGQIGTPFTAQDINGQTVNLANILNSGMSVVIDYSCCWCNPCWVMHQSGILEAIDAMDSVQVIWVEIEGGNTTAQIYGTQGSGSSASTCGNWTVDANGQPVPYPIIDDDANRTCLSTCSSLYEGYVPSIFFISPDGYFCSIYGESYGFGSSTSHTQACANINALRNMAPRAGQVPAISVNGLTSVLAGSTANYSVDYISVDPIVSIDWTFSNGNPATATGQNASTVWANTGNETVICTVTNTTGSTSDTLSINVFEYNFGDCIDYTANGSYSSSVGAGSDITWGHKYPAALLAGRNYLDNVQFYVSYAGTYDLTIYQSNGTPSANDMLYQHTYVLNNTESYATLTLYDQIALDDTKDLWVVLHNAGVQYPASGTEFNGDPNSCLVYYNGAWTPVYELNASLLYTWMIKTTTSTTAPALNIAVNGPTVANTNAPVTFTALGPAAASYSWDFAGATTPSATGMSASATWATAGTYTVTLTATLGTESATATTTVSVVSCDPQNLPFSCGFEGNENYGCWNFVDADGDGYNWDLEFWNGSSYVHSGTGAIGTASYINNIGVLAPDNWMVLPALNIPAEGAFLNYYVGGVGAMYGDKYSIYVNTNNGMNPSDFTGTPIFTEIPTDNNYNVKHVSLMDYAGQTIRIAFRHYDIQDGYWLVFDDLSVTAGWCGIEETAAANVSLYPNPVTSVLNVNAEGLQEVNILDINGRTVMTANTNTINMANLADGVYFVRVITNNGVATQKIVKK